MVKVGYLVSYDYKLIYESISLIYEFASEIWLAIDKDRLTWSGNSFTLPESFFEGIKEIDKNQKVKIYEDSFYIKTLLPMEMETRERAMLSEQMGKGWKIQLDSDEYIYDFYHIKKYLSKINSLNILQKSSPLLFKGKLITLFKKLENGYLIIKNQEPFSFISNSSGFTMARNNDNCFNHKLNSIVVHNSWAREKEEIEQKIKNWGHSNDFDSKSFFDFWNGLTYENYKNFTNFHPLNPSKWDKLEFVEAKSLKELINKLNKKYPQQLTPLGFKSLLKVIINLFLKKRYRK